MYNNRIKKGVLLKKFMSPCFILRQDCKSSDGELTLCSDRNYVGRLSDRDEDDASSVPRRNATQWCLLTAYLLTAWHVQQPVQLLDVMTDLLQEKFEPISNHMDFFLGF